MTMPTESARDRFRVAVEGASGAAAFDGNHSSDIVSWLFPLENWDDRDVPAMLDQLMTHTIRGHLAWVVFVPEGFRIG